MSSYAPPSYVVSIYNPAYFATSSGGLSLATATSLFLNKNTTDTATALETFNGGIATNSIDTAGNSPMVIGSSASKITYSATAIINQFNGTIKAQGQITATAGVTSNNYDSTNATTQLEIGRSQTSSNLYIGANATTATRTTGNINIGTDSTYTGNITLGNISNTNNVVVNGNFIQGAGRVLNLQPVDPTTYTFPANNGHLGYTTITSLTTSTAILTNGNRGTVITLQIPAGIWYVSYALRLVAASGSPVVTTFQCNLEILNVPTGFPTEIAMNSLGTFSNTLNTLGTSNLSFTGSSIVKSTVASGTQNVDLVYYCNSSGSVNAYGNVTPQTYITATRIA